MHNHCSILVCVCACACACVRALLIPSSMYSTHVHWTMWKSAVDCWCCLHLFLCLCPIKVQALCPGQTPQLYGLSVYDSKSVVVFISC